MLIILAIVCFLSFIILAIAATSEIRILPILIMILFSVALLFATFYTPLVRTLTLAHIAAAERAADSR